MAAGLEQGAFQPDSQFTCSGRWTGLPGLTFDCWLSGGHGRLDLVSGLTRSCNSVFYEVGRRLDEIDPNFLPDFALRSGFGGATGAVPAQEPGGTVPGPQWKRQALNDGWARGDAVNMAIGQGNLLVTPLQVAALYGAIAAGGQRRGPRLLDRAQLPGRQRGAPPDAPGEAAPALEGADAGGGAGRAAGGRRGAGRDGRRGLPGVAPGRRRRPARRGRRRRGRGGRPTPGSPASPPSRVPRWWCWRCWSTPARDRRWPPRWPGGCSKSPCGATLPCPHETSPSRLCGQPTAGWPAPRARWPGAPGPAARCWSPAAPPGRQRPGRSGARAAQDPAGERVSASLERRARRARSGPCGWTPSTTGSRPRRRWSA